MKTSIRYGFIAVLVVWVLWKGIIPSWNMIHSDFANYFVSASLVVEHGELERLYDNDWFQAQIKDHGIDEPGKFAPFPPITAWIMVPLTFTDVLTAKRIWTIINCLLLWVCVYLITKLTSWHWSVSAILILSTGNGLVNNFRFGQVYLLITVGMLTVVWLSRKNKSIAGGSLLALLAVIKYLPIALTVGFLMRKNYRLLIYTGATILFLIALQFLFFGPWVMHEFFYSAFVPHLDGNLSGQGMYSFLFQSYDNLFRHLFVYSQEYNPSPLIDWPDGRSGGKVVIYLVILGSLILSLKKIISLVISDDAKTSLLLGLPMLAAFVLLPASASYHFVMLSIPVVLLLSCDFFIARERLVISLLFLFIGFIPYQSFFELANHAGLVFAYPRLWLISILYFVSVGVIMFRVGPATSNN